MDNKKTIKIEAKTDKISHNIAKILGIDIFSGRRSQALNLCLSWIGKKEKKVVFTPNPEFLVAANRDFGFAQMLQKADLCLPDGIGLVLAGRLLGQPIKERISGADLVVELLAEGNRQGWQVGIIGIRHGVKDEIEKLMKNLKEKYPNVRFVDLDNKSEILNPKYETNSNVQNSNDRKGFEFRASNFEIVFACHGMKKQEKWILENKDKIDANLFVGVGGSLDFLGGFSNRAPRLIRVAGFEWLWRGLQRPKHFLRIWRAVVEFGWLVIKEKLNYKF